MNNPAYGHWIPTKVHRSSHGWRGGQFNAFWREFWQLEPDAGYTRQQILDKLRECHQLSPTPKSMDPQSKQNFYLLGASMSKTYAYASGSQDLPNPERFLTPAFLKMSLAFWEVNRPNRQPGIQLDDCQGLKYPDFLFCGGGPPRYFITQKVVDSLHRAEIRGFEALPMPMTPPAREKSRMWSLPSILF